MADQPVEPKKAAEDIKSAEKADPKGGTQAAAELFHKDFVQSVNAGQIPDNFRSGMVANLGEAKVQQLEMTWAKGHIESFKGANAAEVGMDKGIGLYGDNLKGYQSRETDKGEKAFQETVAKDIYNRYGESDFSSFRHNVSPEDLQRRADALGDQSKAAQGLMSSVNPELAKAFGVNKPDGQPATLYDLMKEQDGSVKKFGYQTKLDHLHSQLESLVRPGGLTSDQADSVRKLWDGWNDNPLKNSKTGVIDGDTIKAAVPPEAQEKPTVAPPAEGGKYPANADDAKAAIKTIDAMPPDVRSTLLDKGTTINSVSLDHALENPGLTVNQRKELEELKTKIGDQQIPSHDLITKGYGDDAKAFAGSQTADANSNKDIAAGNLDAISKLPPGIVDKDGNISQEKLQQTMRAIGNPADATYQNLQKIDKSFDDIATKAHEDGKGTMSKADIDQYRKNNGLDEAEKLTPQQQPPKPAELSAELQKQVQQDGDALTPASATIKLSGKGPLIDQATHFLQDRAKATYEQATPEAARQLLADMAKQNKWPGSEAQWKAYAKDGNPKHLPKELNGAMHSGMDMTVPGISALDQKQQDAAVAWKAEQRVPVPDLHLKPEQQDAIKKAAVEAKVPHAESLTPAQINELAARNADKLGKFLVDDQKAAAEKRAAELEAYKKGLNAYLTDRLHPAP
jgi:hypothetical protein